MNARNRAVVGGEGRGGEGMWATMLTGRQCVGESEVSCHEIAALNACYKRPGMNAT